MASEVSLDERARALENEYFHRKEKELIEKMRAKLALEGNQPSTMICPKCQGSLVSSDFENIKIDVCSNCHGVWLDAGELAQALHHIQDKNSNWIGRWFG